MAEWQLQAFLALVTLSMMAPCLFTATTARKVQRPGRKWAWPGAFAATCRPYDRGSSLFKDMHLFVGDGVAYSVYSLRDKGPRT